MLGEEQRHAASLGGRKVGLKVDSPGGEEIAGIGTERGAAVGKGLDLLGQVLVCLHHTSPALDVAGNAEDVSRLRVDDAVVHVFGRRTNRRAYWWEDGELHAGASTPERSNST